MATDGIAAFGAQLKIGASIVGELTNMETPSLATDFIDVTNHESASGFKEYVAGLKDGESIAIEGNYVPADAGQAAMRVANLAGTKSSFTLTLPGSLGVWTFDGFVNAIKATAPYDGKLGFTAQIKVSGLPAFA